MEECFAAQNRWYDIGPKQPEREIARRAGVGSDLSFIAAKLAWTWCSPAAPRGRARGVPSSSLISHQLLACGKKCKRNSEYQYHRPA